MFYNMFCMLMIICTFAIKERVLIMWFLIIIVSIFIGWYIYLSASIAWKFREIGYRWFSWIIFIISIMITPFLMWFLVGDMFPGD